MRVFVAIPLPGPLLDQLQDVQRQLGRRVPPGSVRWVRPEGIHLTLKFLGDTGAGRLPLIHQVLVAAASGHAPFAYAVNGLGCFPSTRKPRVVWVGLDEPSGSLAALQKAVEQGLAALGYQPEERGFTPHLTLGRVRDRLPVGDVAAIGEAVLEADVGRLGEERADRFELIRSVLKPDGAEYATLAVFRLGAE